MRCAVVALLVASGCRLGFDSGTPSRDASGGADDDAPPSLDDAPVQTTDGKTADAAPLTCPGNYVAIDTSASRYRAVDNSMSWLTAQQMCEADGHHLVIVDTASEVTLVAALLPTQNIWTGVTARKTIGVFLKVTGGAATYLPWDSGEPDADALECTFIDSLTLKLADQDCGSGRRPVCECDGLPADPTTY